MKKHLLALLFITATSVAFADEMDFNRHHGFYAEITGGTNAYYAGVLSSRVSLPQGGIEGGAVGVALGYHFTPTIALDFSPSVALEVGNIVSFIQINHGMNADMPYVTSRFDVPIGSRINFIAKLGGMAILAPGVGGLVLPFTGVGFSYAVTKNLEVAAQYQGAFYGIAAVGMAALGLTYHF